MEESHSEIFIPATGRQTEIAIRSLPGMPGIFLKAFLLSGFRPDTLDDRAQIPKIRMVFKGFVPDPKRVARYREVCGFSETESRTIPVTCLQTFFIGLLGKFVTSSGFPLNPMGLIQTFQSFEQKRPVRTDETLNLSCTLLGFTKREKGIETRFALAVESGEETPWQGVSAFFTRSRGKKKPSAFARPEDLFLEERETIAVPDGIGRSYAGVSGDFNPHHLHSLPARLLGFKGAMAHGMWSLARTVAGLDREWDLHSGPVRLEAAFKLPVFIPAVTVLGWESGVDTNTGQEVVHFELRDQKDKRPHLKGRLFR